MVEMEIGPSNSGKDMGWGAGCKDIFPACWDFQQGQLRIVFMT